MNLNRVGILKRFVFPCALIVLFILFFFGGPDYYSSRFFQRGWNLGHILFFSLLPLYIVSLSKRIEKSLFNQFVVVFGLAILLGGLIEIIQGGIQQDSEYGDLFRDIIGGMVGMFFLLSGRKMLSPKILKFCQILTVCLVGIQLYPVITALSDACIMRYQFPVLSDFETPFEIERWNGDAGRSISDAISINGQHSMKVQLGTEIYSGVNLRYFRGDWEGVNGFEFSVYNPDREDIKITCRIHDKKHVDGKESFNDRFNRTFALAQGWHTIRIEADDILHAPEGRTMDFRHILGVGIFATRLYRPRIIYIDYVRVCY